MSKVIYFTNAVNPEMFVSYLKEWKVSPNLSNQNFHSKLIKAISLYSEVEVISIRPINKNFSKSSLPQLETKDKNITWKYPKVTTNKVGKFLLLNNRINKVLSLDKNKNLILVDVLNLSLLKEAHKLAKKKGYKIFGVCTDNPYNISFVKKSYTTKLLNLAQQLDSYISLTEGINELFNVNNKPFIIIDGVNEDIKNIKESKIKGNYIYFGGSLMKEYGLYDLIDAFNELNLKDYKLVVCGHHLMPSLLNKIKDNQNILYLGAVDYEENLSLEKWAIVTVNPRPINPKIDQYSIPSKTLECLSVGALNITVDNEILKKNYQNCIIWAKSSSKEDLKDAIKKAIGLSKQERDKYTKLAKEKVMARTSLEVIGKIIHDLII